MIANRQRRLDRDVEPFAPRFIAHAMSEALVASWARDRRVDYPRWASNSASPVEEPAAPSAPAKPPFTEARSVLQKVA
jgi:hypothetical protein